MAFYVDNAIFWAQFRLRGGWKNLLIIASTYAAAVLLFITLPYQLETRLGYKLDVLAAASTLILIVQVVMLLVLGALAVSGSLRRDVTNRLMESHRLMPLSPVQAIIGYIAGSGLSVLSLCLVNLLIGAVLSRMRGIPVQLWLISNGLLFAFSITIWTAMSIAAFLSRAMFGIVLALCISIVFSSGFIFVLAPGLLAFCSPMHGLTIFGTTARSLSATGTVVALVAQALVSLLCLRGAARKYADANALSFPLAAALAVLGIWAGLSWFGIYDFHELAPPMLQVGFFDWRLLVVGAIASSLLVAMLPLAAVAWSGIRRRQRREGGDAAPRRLWPLALCLGVSTLFVLAPITTTINSTIVYPPQFHYTQPAPAPPVNPQTKPSRNRPIPATARPSVYFAATPPPSYPIPILRMRKLRVDVPLIAAACAIFLLQTYALMLLLCPAVRRANLLILLITAMLWFVPLLADVSYYAAQNQEPALDVVAPYSTLGSISQALGGATARPWMGIAGQGLLCALLLALSLSMESRRGRRRPASIGSPADL
jgi:hypothetical protein